MKTLRRELWPFAAVTLLGLLLAAAALGQVDVKTFKRGAKPSPRLKVAATPAYRAVEAPPPQYAWVPPQLRYWLNDQKGVCVTSETCFAIAAWSFQCQQPEVIVPDEEVDRWARKYGFDRGAILTDVMDVMQRDGLRVNGVEYRTGPYFRVDYTNEGNLSSAIFDGPVSVAIDADALPSGAGNVQGWYALGDRAYRNTDHCIDICGYGSAEFLYGKLGVPMPAALAGRSGYLAFTWSTIGFVDHKWIKNTVVEAWVRKPTVPSIQPPSKVTAPDLVGKKFSEAEAVCSALGLKCVLSAGDPARPIATQSPAAGIQVAPGSTVTVSSVPVPGPPDPPTPGDIVIRVPAGTAPGTYTVGEGGLSKEDAEKLKAAQEAIEAILKRQAPKPEPKPDPEKPPTAAAAAYGAAYAACRVDGLPLAVFVGCPARGLPGIRSVRWDGFPGVESPAVVVTADLKRGTFLPAACGEGDIVAAASCAECRVRP